MNVGSITPPPIGYRPTTLPGPQPIRWTIAQYRELGKLGLLGDVRTMLIDGEILTVAQPAPPHNTALNLAYEFVRAAFPTGHHVRNQMALDVGIRNDPSPDLAVVQGSIRDYAARQATTAVLVVEVADSSLFLDTTTKAELYATAGVPEYWVVDLENQRLLVYRDPVSLPAGLGATAYRTQLVLTPADSIAQLAAPTASVRVADLLP